MINIDQIIPDLERPDLYTVGKSNMWDDSYISQQMLKAHLNPNFDGASRKGEHIKRSIDWINSKIDSKSKILDLGCGPGLYTSQLSKKGHLLTGIDFSKTSINYAIKTADKEKLNVEYIYKNYMAIEYENCFDLITLIYCDFGVLALNDQNILLNKIFKALKKGGKLIFDVLSSNYFDKYEETTKWNLHKTGFWRPHQHLALKNCMKYPDELVTLEEYQIIDKNGIELFRNWNKCYKEQEIIDLLKKCGFTYFETYADLTGRPNKQAEDVIAIITQK